MDSDTTFVQIERIKQLERLVELSRSLCNSLDLEPFLHLLITTASELTDCEAASIMELDEGGEQLRFLALPWFHREALKSIKVPLKSSIAGFVYESAKPLMVPV